jgi:hypothetical protein
VPESREPSADDDDELMAELRALLARVDPVPKAVLVTAEAVFDGEP